MSIFTGRKVLSTAFYWDGHAPPAPHPLEKQLMSSSKCRSDYQAGSGGNRRVGGLSGEQGMQKVIN